MRGGDFFVSFWERGCYTQVHATTGNKGARMDHIIWSTVLEGLRTGLGTAPKQQAVVNFWLIVPSSSSAIAFQALTAE